MTTTEPFLFTKNKSRVELIYIMGACVSIGIQVFINLEDMHITTFEELQEVVPKYRGDPSVFSFMYHRDAPKYESTEEAHHCMTRPSGYCYCDSRSALGEKTTNLIIDAIISGKEAVFDLLEKEYVKGL